MNKVAQPIQTEATPEQIRDQKSYLSMGLTDYE